MMVGEEAPAAAEGVSIDGSEDDCCCYHLSRWDVVSRMRKYETGRNSVVAGGDYTRQRKTCSRRESLAE